MDFEIRLDERLANVILSRQEEDLFTFEIDGREYLLDIVMVEEGVYSILYNGKSYIIELIEVESPKKYIVNTKYKTFDLEIIDSETRYIQNRKKSIEAGEEGAISSPMPGKVIKIPVKIGDEIESGQTVIIISAMKMESEYKAGKKGRIKEILTREGAVIEGNQILITIE